jgi:hypothetical protein
MYAYRNAAYNKLGTIDCEIQHPSLGWVPFTADPNDVAAHGRELYAAVIADGNIAAYLPPTPEEARAALPDLSRKQFRLGMRDLGITSAMIDATLSAIPDEEQKEIAQIEWEDSDSYSRMHPLIAQIAATFGKADEQIDTAWANALTYI